MKNDFRDFYDEEYIMHKAYENSTEDELMHGEWLNKFRKYIDKIRTASGKWRYIYPEDLKKKAADIKRDASYKVRNTVSKVTGKNRTFEKNVASESNSKPGQRFKDNRLATRYEKVQREARKGLVTYRDKQEKRKKLAKISERNTNKKLLKENNRVTKERNKALTDYYNYDPSKAKNKFSKEYYDNIERHTNAVLARQDGNFSYIKKTTAKKHYDDLSSKSSRNEQRKINAKNASLNSKKRKIKEAYQQKKTNERKEKEYRKKMEQKGYEVIPVAGGGYFYRKKKFKDRRYG